MAFSLRLMRQFRAFRPAPWLVASKPRRFDRAGAAAVEFAILGPLLLAVLMGIFAYGGYFLTAHTVQQIANDAARAAIAGLDDSERSAIATQTARAGITTHPSLRGDITDLRVAREGHMLVVRLVYNAGDDPYWAFMSLVPAPPPVIERTASIRIGGF
ncbi:MAG: TadE family protein [Hyphomonadaceae bacterium]